MDKPAQKPVDPVDAAIAAADKPEPIEMTVMQGAFSDSGRPFEIAVPQTMTEAEAFALVELVVRIRQQVQANEAKSSRIVGLDGRRLPMS